MKRIVLTAALVALGSASAFAADLPPRSYAKAPAMAIAATNWSGLYLGGNVGYGWGNGGPNVALLPSSDFGIVAPTFGGRRNGAVGGAQIGYNWQAGSIVTGFEADIQGSAVRGSDRTVLSGLTGAPVPGLLGSSDQRMSWFGTFRGRVGFTAIPELLIYATGGLAYGQIDASADTFFTSTNHYPTSVSQTKAGWTVGGGTEWAFARNWSAKIEYLYVDLGNVSVTALNAPADNGDSVRYTWHTKENIVRAGVNYHL